jgi:hypothetical protein
MCTNARRRACMYQRTRTKGKKRSAARRGGRSVDPSLINCHARVGSRRRPEVRCWAAAENVYGRVSCDVGTRAGADYVSRPAAKRFVNPQKTNVG